MMLVRSCLTTQNRVCRPLCSHAVARKDDNTFEEAFKKNYIPINGLQRKLLAFGSATMSILDPHRYDMIAVLSETTGQEAVASILNCMEKSIEGLSILRERPRINTTTVNLSDLEKLPDDSLGQAYLKFLQRNKVTPDSRTSVQFVDDPNLAYVIQRYREIHDLVHTVLGMPTHMLGEVTVKWVEAIQTKFPMCIGGAVFGAIRLKPKQRILYRNYYLPWAIQTGEKSNLLMNVYFEKRWEQSLADFQKEMRITPLTISDTKITSLKAN